MYALHRFVAISYSYDIELITNAYHNQITDILSGHSLEGTHSLESSSMIVPAGHPHTPIALQTSEQTLKPNLLAHVVAHVGSIPHCLKICPLTVQFPVNSKHNYMLTL